MNFTEHNVDGLIYTAVDGLGVRHAFTTRLGGADTGGHSSLNLGENRTEHPDAVRENYRRLGAAVGISHEKMVWCRQVHSTDVLESDLRHVCRLYEGGARTADGLMSDVPGLGLIAFTADCIPILLHDPVHGAVAALHAGWKGSLKDMAGAGVRAMCRRYGSRPEDILAAIGPGIGACCFQVSEDVREALFAVLGREAEEFISTVPAQRVNFPPQDADERSEPYPDEPVPGKYFIDLKGADRTLLLRAGLAPEHIAVSTECTRCRPDRYWSHRFHGLSRGSQGCIIAANER